LILEQLEIGGFWWFWGARTARLLA